MRYLLKYALVATDKKYLKSIPLYEPLNLTTSHEVYYKKIEFQPEKTFEACMDLHHVYLFFFKVTLKP